MAQVSSTASSLSTYEMTSWSFPAVGELKVKLIHTFVCKSVCVDRVFRSVGHIFRSLTAVLYWWPMFSFLRNCPMTHPWDSPGKNSGVGCHFLLQCMKVKSESELIQSCTTLSDPMDCGLPGASVHGILQARVLGGVPLPSPDEGERGEWECWL